MSSPDSKIEQTAPKPAHMELSRKERRTLAKKRKLRSFLNLISPSNTEMEGTNDASPEELRKKLKEQASPKLVLCEKAYKYRKEGKPFNLSDVQSLLISCFIPYTSDFAKISLHNAAERVCVFLVGPNIQLSDLDDGYFSEKFNLQIDNLDPESWLDCLLKVDLSRSQSRKMKERGLDTTIIYDENEHETTAIGKTQLILTEAELKSNGFPTADDESFLHTKSSYKPITDDSPLFSLDCEMCKTAIDRFEVARVTLLNGSGEVILDTFVKPFSEIYDYVTAYSGVTKEKLDQCTTRLNDVQEKMCEILPADAILVGQSLENDLKCLQLYHPYIIDTSICYNLSGHKDRKTSLKVLSSVFLGKSIQNSTVKGHCSKEDALAALKLVQLKLKKGKKFGNCVLSGKRVDDMRHFMNLGDFLQAKVVDGKSKFKFFYELIDPTVPKFISVINDNRSLVPGIAKFSNVMSMKPKSIMLVVSASHKTCWISCK